MKARETTAGQPLEGWAIEAARNYAGLTRKAFAEKLGEALGENWTAVRVRNVETGKAKASYAVVSAVAALTGFPVSWFGSDPAGDAQRYRSSRRGLQIRRPSMPARPALLRAALA